MLRVCLFGGISLTWNDQPLPLLANPVARALFSYLITFRQQAQPRHLLAGLFWPDLPEAVARQRLRQALHHIRSALDIHPLLLSEGDAVRIDPGLPIWVDVEELMLRYQAARANAANAAADYRVCLELYRGEFLEGVYDDWALTQREHLKGIYFELLGHLITLHKSRGEYEAALSYARRLAAHDIWNEAAHREVMRLCHLLGRHAEALRQYETCRRFLADELGAAPDAETLALYQEITRRAGKSVDLLLPAAARPALTTRLEHPDDLPLVGRQDELGLLLRQAEAAARGDGGLTLLYGEAGIGKSRLLRELAHNARWRGLPVAWGRAYELSAAQPFQPLVEILRDWLAGLDEESLPGPWLGILACLLPELRRTPGAPAAPESHRDVLEALARALLALAAKSPRLALLEDAQWMDAGSLDLLRYLLPRLAGAPLRLVLTVRSEDLRGAPAAALSALENTRLTAHLALHPLDQAETGDLVQQALEMAGPAPRFSARLYAETGGNPFFVIETLLALVDDGVLYRLPDGSWNTRWDDSTCDYAELPLPSGAVQSIERRLEHLPAALHDALDLAAAIGRQVRFDVWAAAAGVPVEECLAAADEFCRRGLFGAAAPGQEPSADYAFTHDLIRRVIYQRLSAPRRRLLHARIARTLQHLFPASHAALAYHYTLAEEWGQAALCQQRAGDQARRQYAIPQALAHYNQALEALTRLPPACAALLEMEIRLGREAIYDLLGERTAQAADLQALETLAAAQEDDLLRGRVFLRRANYADACSDYLAAQHFAQQAIAGARRAGDLGLEAAGYRQSGRALWRQGDFDQARALLQNGLELARRAALPAVQAECLNDLGNIAGQRGEYRPAAAYFEQALDIFRQAGDFHSQGRILNNLGLVARHLGEPERAMSFHQQALRLRREIGDPRGESASLNNLGMLALDQGDHLQARRYHQEALRLRHEVGDRNAICISLANLGFICTLLGDYPSARTYLDDALQIGRQIGDRRQQGEILADMAFLQRQSGRPRRALARARQALELLAPVGDRSSMAYVFLSQGHAHLALDQLDEAQAAFQQAWDIYCQLGTVDRAVEYQAALLRVLVRRGGPALQDARPHLETILAYLDGHPAFDRISDPLDVYLAVYQALDALADPRRAAVLEAAYARLQQLANGLPGDPERRQFLKNIPSHRQLAACYEQARSNAGERRIVLRLPRLDAPLGRRLHPDEWVTVAWSVPDAASGTSQEQVPRRRSLILSLIDQARRQNAAPRDEDLARALEVSLATLRRDMQALRRQGGCLPTRGRK